MSRKDLNDVPKDMLPQLAALDKKHGFPEGLLASIMVQETSANPAYLKEPHKFHYPKRADGTRGPEKPGADGKLVNSSAFGPFGILLDSTAKQPGYGVTPLQSQYMPEQMRFAGEYLAARIKQAGGLEQGLGAYGQGKPYADEVLARIGHKSAAPVTMAAAPVPTQAATTVAQAAPVAAAAPQGDGAVGGVLTPELVAALNPKLAEVPQGANQWDQFVNTLPANKRSMVPGDLAYGLPQMGPPPVIAAGSVNPGKVDFSAFSGYGKKRRA